MLFPKHSDFFKQDEETMWCIESGSLTGGLSERGMWDQSLYDTEARALAQIEKLVRMGVTVHSLKAPGGNEILNATQIAERFPVLKNKNSN